ncbi:hypothetical protein [Micrococcoides hystricis]|uniref:Serine protease n=1 Tax=Micrococcoides hystricis TaxID=1572761 RepID=A0ABV6PB90_9MICC
MAQNNPQQPYPSDPNDPNASNPYRDQPLAEPFNDRPADGKPRFPSDLPEFKEGQTPSKPMFPSDLPQYKNDSPAGYSQPKPQDPSAGYSTPHDPSADRFHNPQYEWAQGNQQSYPSGGARMIRWVVPIAIIAMVAIFFLTQ